MHAAGYACSNHELDNESNAYYCSVSDDEDRSLVEKLSMSHYREKFLVSN